MQYECIIAGDFNADLFRNDDNIVNRINGFVTQNSLTRCNDLFTHQVVSTYINTALNHESCIDYVFGTSETDIISFDVLDLNLNFSDHMPLLVSVNVRDCSSNADYITSTDNRISVQLRWDKADTISFYHYTGVHLQPVLDKLDSACQEYDDHSSKDICDLIEEMYATVVHVLSTAANLYVPARRKSFYKFWWDEDLSNLKQASIDSNNVWKAAGKPRTGPIFNKRQQCRLQYRSRLREG